MSFWNDLGNVALAVSPMGLVAKGLTAMGANDLMNANSGPQFNASSFNPASYSGSPYSSALLQSIQGMPKFSPVTAPGSIYTPSQPYQMNAYQAKDMSNTALPQYDAMRARLNSQYSQQQSQAQDSLDRQFAAMGGGPGNGAQAKQTENLATGIAQQKGNDLMGINAQEGQTRTALQQQEEQKAFESGEQQKGYAFQAGQADLGRQFQANELQAQQGMQAQEFNQQMGMQQNQFNFDANAKIAGLNQAYQQSQSDAAIQAFNAQMEQYKQRHSGGLLGAGGFLGSGIGA